MKKTSLWKLLLVIVCLCAWTAGAELGQDGAAGLWYNAALAETGTQTEPAPADEFAYIVVDDHVEIRSYLGKRLEVVVPETIEGKPVTVIKLGKTQYETWDGRWEDVRRIVLPKTIQRLSAFAFGGYIRLTEVEGLEYVQEIEENVFEDTALQEVRFSQNLRRAGTDAFGNCNASYLTIPDDAEYAFRALGDIRAQDITLLRGEGEPTIQMLDGAIYSADGKTLKCVTPMCTKICYTVRPGTEEIEYNALYSGIYVDEYEIPESVTTFLGNDVFCRSGITINVYRNSAMHAFLKNQVANNGLQIKLCVLDGENENSLQALVDAVIAQTIHDGMTDLEKARALHDWICDNASYDYTLTHFSAASIFTEGTGVCDAYCRAYGVLLDAAGIENRRESCWLENTSHAITAVKLDGQWCYVDTTNDDEGFGHPDELFGFNSAMFRKLYFGDLSVQAEGLEHYAPLLSGALDAPLASLRSLIQERLDAGSNAFIVALPDADRADKILTQALAYLMQSETWLAQGKESTMECTVRSDGSFLCVMSEADAVAFDYRQVDGGICLTSYRGSDTNVAVPAEIDGMPVVALECTFCKNAQLESVTLPEGVRSIGSNTFESCTGLKSVTFPAGLEEIGAYAFFGCTALETELVFTDNLKVMADFAFAECKYIKKCVLPGGLTTVGRGLFAQCSSLESVVLEEGLTALRDSMFHACSSLKQLTLPESLRTIETSALMKSSVVKLHLPANVEQVAWDAFYKADRLVSLTVSEDNPYLAACGNMLLTKDMKKLLVSSSAVDESLRIPAGVEVIGKQAFCMNPKLHHVYIPSSVRTIEEAAFLTGELDSVYMEDGVETIGKYAFAAMNCSTEGAYYEAMGTTASACKELRLSVNLKSIGEGAFLGNLCLKELVLPAGLTSLDVHFINYPQELFVPPTITYIADQEMLQEGGGWGENIIHGLPGTYAEEYAKAHGYQFVAEGGRIVLNAATTDLLPKEAVTLTARLFANGSESLDPALVEWTSSNPQVATVENGVVQAVSGGAVTITAAYGGLQGSCDMSVMADDYYELEWNIDGYYPQSLVMVVGEKAEVFGQAYSNITKWRGELSVEGDAVVDVYFTGGGAWVQAKAIAPGRCTVTLTLPDGRTIHDDILVIGTAFTYLDIPDTFELFAGMTAELPVELYRGCKRSDIRWTSSAAELIAVDENGLLTALAAGEAQITAQIGSYQESCRVTVKPPCTEHTAELLPALAPTYTEKGLTKGMRCSVCGQLLLAQTELPELPMVNITRLPAGLGIVEAEAFAGDDGITAVSLPANGCAIGSRAFANCAALEYVDIPDGDCAIADDAFEGSPNVVILTTPGSPVEAWAEANHLTVADRAFLGNACLGDPV